MYKGIRTTEKPTPQLTTEQQLQADLAVANQKLVEQETRLQLMEADTLAFQDFVLSTIGGV